MRLSNAKLVLSYVLLRLFCDHHITRKTEHIFPDFSLSTFKSMTCPRFRDRRGHLYYTTTNGDVHGLLPQTLDCVTRCRDESTIVMLRQTLVWFAFVSPQAIRFDIIWQMIKCYICPRWIVITLNCSWKVYNYERRKDRHTLCLHSSTALHCVSEKNVTQGRI